MASRGLQKTSGKRQMSSPPALPLAGALKASPQGQPRLSSRGAVAAGHACVGTWPLLQAPCFLLPSARTSLLRPGAAQPQQQA